MTKLILIAVVTLTALAAPRAVTAQSCTQGYEQCLNDTWETAGVFRAMADIECLAAYIGCVRRSM